MSLLSFLSHLVVSEDRKRSLSSDIPNIPEATLPLAAGNIFINFLTEVYEPGQVVPGEMIIEAREGARQVESGTFVCF